MKRCFIPVVLAVSLLAGIDLSAQTPGRFRLGVMAGTQVTHARMQNTDTDYASATSTVFTNAAPQNLGWMAGVIGQFDISNQLTLEASLGLSHDATHTDGSYYDPIDERDEAMYSNDDFTWIENSVSLTYKFLKRPSFSLYGGLGLATHVLIKSNMALGFEDSKGVPQAVTPYMNTWNYALPIAAGIEFPIGSKKFNCTFSYHVGLRGVYAPQTFQSLVDPVVYFEDGRYKLNATSLSLAYIFSSFGQGSSKN